MVTFDARTPGTVAEAWRASGRLDEVPALDLEPFDRLVVIASHPDDETLGAGGLIADFGHRGLHVHVVVVSDGAASGEIGIAARRSDELAAAMAELAPEATITELLFPDGRLDETRDELRPLLARLVGETSPTTLIACPWNGDGHRDHRVVGELIDELTASSDEPRQVIGYPIWMWHWADPDDDELPWTRLRALPIDQAAKERALSHYGSQTDGEDPVLRPEFLRNFRGGAEFFIPAARRLPPAYFDELYARKDDPWSFLSRWYEERKRAITLAALPRRRYARALEVGCSIGILTSRLAGRCDSLLAVDVSQDAVDRARSRTPEHVRLEVIDVSTRFPPGPFDLILFSEVGYYFDPATLSRVIDRAVESLSENGELLACHWRHPVTDYPLRGDDVHDILATALGVHGIRRTVRHEEDDFVLEVWTRDGQSVAEREGLA